MLQFIRSGVKRIFKKCWKAEDFVNHHTAEAGPGVKGAMQEGLEPEFGSYYHLWSFCDLLTARKTQVRALAMLQRVNCKQKLARG